MSRIKFMLIATLAVLAVVGTTTVASSASAVANQTQNSRSVVAPPQPASTELVRYLGSPNGNLVFQVRDGVRAGLQVFYQGQSVGQIYLRPGLNKVSPCAAIARFLGVQAEAENEVYHWSVSFSVFVHQEVILQGEDAIDCTCAGHGKPPKAPPATAVSGTPAVTG